MPIRKDTFLKLTDVRTKTSLDVNLNNISDLGVAKIDNIIDQRPQFAWYCDGDLTDPSLRGYISNKPYVNDIVNSGNLKIDGLNDDVANGPVIENKPFVPDLPSGLLSGTSGLIDGNNDNLLNGPIIINKPTIPQPQIQSDGNQTDDTQPDYIKNKPTIPQPQIQSDGNQTDDTQPDYIKNKPTGGDVPDYVKTDHLEGTTTALDGIDGLNGLQVHPDGKNSIYGLYAKETSSTTSPSFGITVQNQPTQTSGTYKGMINFNPNRTSTIPSANDIVGGGSYRMFGGQSLANPFNGLTGDTVLRLSDFCPSNSYNTDTGSPGSSFSLNNTLSLTYQGVTVQHRTIGVNAPNIEMQLRSLGPSKAYNASSEAPFRQPYKSQVMTLRDLFSDVSAYKGRMIFVTGSQNNTNHTGSGSAIGICSDIQLSSSSTVPGIVGQITYTTGGTSSPPGLAIAVSFRTDGTTGLVFYRGTTSTSQSYLANYTETTTHSDPVGEILI